MPFHCSAGGGFHEIEAEREEVAFPPKLSGLPLGTIGKNRLIIIGKSPALHYTY